MAASDVKLSNITFLINVQAPINSDLYRPNICFDVVIKCVYIYVRLTTGPVLPNRPIPTTGPIPTNGPIS